MFTSKNMFHMNFHVECNKYLCVYVNVSKIPQMEITLKSKINE